MNEKELGEIRRRIRPGKNNMSAIYGCYVNDKKEIISQFRLPLATMPENESEKYYALLRRSLSGGLNRSLIDICFQTKQVADSPEHKLLMDLRSTKLQDDTVLQQFYEKVIAAVSLDSAYAILLTCETYDVPFKAKDGQNHQDSSEESFCYILCAVCPVKQTKSALRYVPQEQTFHDGGVYQALAAPELGFLFPAFDNRSTNIYNALYYSHNLDDSRQEFVDTVFNVGIPKPAKEQKRSFEALLGASLEEECSMDVVQNVHQQLRQRMEMHKEARVPEPLMISKEDVKDVLYSCGIDESKVAKFSVDFDSEFGFETQIAPANVIDKKRFEVKTPDVVIHVNPERSDLIETRVIGGVKYILVCADEDVEVNGVSIQIGRKEPAGVV